MTSTVELDPVFEISIVIVFEIVSAIAFVIVNVSELSIVSIDNDDLGNESAIVNAIVFAVVCLGFEIEIETENVNLIGDVDVRGIVNEIADVFCSQALWIHLFLTNRVCVVFR